MSDTSKMRINRAIAQAGVCSRRRADELIQAGRVAVNGETVTTPGLKVDPAMDRIEVDGHHVDSAPADPANQLYLLLHKPPKVMTTLHDPQGRTTVLDLLPKEIATRRPVPVGRLDFMSEGLLLMSTDGDLVHRLTHPRFHLPKIYHVLIKGAAPSHALKTMQQGMRLSDGQVLAPVAVRSLERRDKETLLQLTLIQGVNRQIRRMCKDLGLPISRLRRVAQGPVELGDLPPKSWRHLRSQEVNALQKAVGL